MGWADRVFPVLILLCMAAGLAAGKLAPGLGRLLEPWIPLGLFLMIYPAVAAKGTRPGRTGGGARGGVRKLREGRWR